MIQGFTGIHRPMGHDVSSSRGLSEFRVVWFDYGFGGFRIHGWGDGRLIRGWMWGFELRDLVAFSETIAGHK